MIRLGVLASHTGTNFQAILDACQSTQLNAEVTVLISNNSRARVVTRAIEAGVPFKHLSSKTHPTPELLDIAMRNTLESHQVELVVLAGYMKKLGPAVLSRFHNRIINVHPSLLPRYGGVGFYGARVHEAVLAAGDTQTGATVHLVNEAYDDGAILLQESIEVEPGDTPESLAERLRPVEHRLLIQSISQFSENPGG